MNLVDQVLELDSKATPGPWHHDEERLYGCCTSQPNGTGRILCTMGREGEHNDADRPDARLIALYRTAAPELAKRVRELEATIAAIRSEVKSAVLGDEWSELCAEKLDNISFILDRS